MCKKILALKEYWIIGFTEGEGCFSVSFSLLSRMPLGIEVRPCFSISQKSHSLKALLAIQEYFNCGGIRYSSKDGTYKYEVRSLKNLKDIIIPFFSSYNFFLTKKGEDFFLFKDICKLISQGEHLNKKGLNTIIKLAYKMNGSGKRKYTEEFFLKFISKLKR